MLRTSWTAGWIEPASSFRDHIYLWFIYCCRTVLFVIKAPCRWKKLFSPLDGGILRTTAFLRAKVWGIELGFWGVNYRHRCWCLYFFIFIWIWENFIFRYSTLCINFFLKSVCLRELAATMDDNCVRGMLPIPSLGHKRSSINLIWMAPPWVNLDKLV